MGGRSRKKGRKKKFRSRLQTQRDSILVVSVSANPVSSRAPEPAASVRGPGLSGSLRHADGQNTLLAAGGLHSLTGACGWLDHGGKDDVNLNIQQN